MPLCNDFTRRARRARSIHHGTTVSTEKTTMRLGGDSLNERTGHVIDAALRVHTLLGPGLLESAYEACLAHELRKGGLAVVTQVPIPVEYDGLRIEVGYRADLLVDSIVIVEVKATSKLLPVHEAQLLSYLRLAKKRVGLLLNFHEVHMRDGIRRLRHDGSTPCTPW
jgi:GxxExxY protein